MNVLLLLDQKVSFDLICCLLSVIDIFCLHCIISTYSTNGKDGYIRLRLERGTKLVFNGSIMFACGPYAYL